MEEDDAFAAEAVRLWGLQDDVYLQGISNVPPTGGRNRAELLRAVTTVERSFAELT